MYNTHEIVPFFSSFWFLQSLNFMVLERNHLQKGICPSPKEINSKYLSQTADKHINFSFMKCLNCHMMLMNRENSIMIVYFIVLVLFWSASSEFIWNFFSELCKGNISAVNLFIRRLFLIFENNTALKNYKYIYRFFQWPWSLYNTYTHKIKNLIRSAQFSGNIKKCVRKSRCIYVGHSCYNSEHLSSILFAEV